MNSSSTTATLMALLLIALTGCGGDTGSDPQAMSIPVEMRDASDRVVVTGRVEIAEDGPAASFEEFREIDCQAQYQIPLPLDIHQAEIASDQIGDLEASGRLAVTMSRIYGLGETPDGWWLMHGGFGIQRIDSDVVEAARQGDFAPFADLVAADYRHHRLRMLAAQERNAPR